MTALKLVAAVGFLLGTGALAWGAQFATKEEAVATVKKTVARVDAHTQHKISQLKAVVADYLKHGTPSTRMLAGLAPALRQESDRKEF